MNMRWSLVGSIALLGTVLVADVANATTTVSYGRIPSGSVVISGSLPKNEGKYSLYAAIIVKRVDAQTRAKTSLNDLLRD